MRRYRLSLAVVGIALLTVACGGASGGSPGETGQPPSGPPGSPSGSPATGEVEHSTSPEDILLSLEEGGGFVPIDFAATQAPTFALYGDGRVVFKQHYDLWPTPSEEPGPRGGVPFRTATLSEDQIQDLLAFALGPGGLGTARDSYGNDGIADASTSTFAVNAGGVDKTVAVYALAESEQTGPDAAARAAFATLAGRLRDFDDHGSVPTDVYEPEAFRGVLFETEGVEGVEVTEWPWADITVADFVAPAGDQLGLPRRTMTPEEVAVFGVEDMNGGATGIYLQAPDDKVYQFFVRPLLPGEEG